MKPPPLSNSSPYLLTGDPPSLSCYYEIIEDGSEAGRMVPAELEEIFFERRTVNPRQEVLSTVRRGELTPEVHERAANPAKYLDEPFLYHSQLMTDADADGNEVTTYRILRQRNPRPAAKLLTPPGPPRVDPALWPHVETLRPEDDLLLLVKLAGLPDPVVPLPLPPERFDAQTVATNAERIQAAKLAHTSLVEEKLELLDQDFQRWGVRVIETFEGIAWVKLSLPVQSLDILLSHSSITAVELDAVDAQDLGCTGTPPLNQDMWLLGEGRRADRMDIDRFHAAGHTGHRANATRHGYSRLLAGVVESSWLEDELPAFSGRFIFKKDCSVSPCVYPPNYNYPDDDEHTYPELNGVLYWREKYQTAGKEDSSGSHGSMVSSIFTGNYLNNEAYGVSMGDPTWDGSGEHCDPWENASTGMAPGAYLWYVNAMLGGNSSSSSRAAYIRAYNTLNTYNIDVLNCSHSLTTADCKIAPTWSTEDTLENLYDNGVLIVAAAGNNLLEYSNTDCSLNSPGDTPKVLAVAGLDANDLSFQNDTCSSPAQRCCRGTPAPSNNWGYQSCILDDRRTATGGIDLIINGTPRARAYSGIAVSAAQEVYHASFSRNMDIAKDIEIDSGLLFLYGTNGNPWPHGWVSRANHAAAGGTSAAAPHVAGAGVVLKHWQLYKGNTVFNNPGAMQALLLAMSDRWDPDLGRRVLGVDEKSGFGRLKLRLLDQVLNGPFIPTAFYYNSFSFTSSSPSAGFYAWPTPMPNETDFVKCVMFEPEDMSQESGPNVSDLYLQMNLRDPDSNGSCSAYSPYYYGYHDSSYDLRHMAASQGNQNVGRCLQVTISKRHVDSEGATVRHCQELCVS